MLCICQVHFLYTIVQNHSSLCLDGQSFVENGVLKLPTTVVLLFISPFALVLLCVFRSSNVGYMNVDNYRIYLMDQLFYHYLIIFFVSLLFLVESILSHRRVVTPVFLVLPFARKIFFYLSLLVYVCV